MHLGLGTALLIGLVILRSKEYVIRRGFPVGFLFFLISALLGAYLAYDGSTLPNRRILWAHIITASLGLLAMIPFVWNKAAERGGDWRTFKHAFPYCSETWEGANSRMWDRR